ncbi:MAG: hypothetical protein II884_04785, partial [Synergistaceae bacterium]|nr:hypothetical protein [Synergistaceae bacterium]
MNTKYKIGMALYRSLFSTGLTLGGMKILKRKYKNDMYGRDGKVQDIPEGCVWVHAVSVGEVQSASSLIRQIKRTSTYPCIISTVTTTGRDMAMRLLDGVADKIIHSPFDSKKFVSRSLDNIKPAIYITMETELWPEMLSQLRARNIPAFLANGRISEKSFKRMRHTKSFWNGVLECLNKL